MGCLDDLTVEAREKFSELCTSSDAAAMLVTTDASGVTFAKDAAGAAWLEMVEHLADSVITHLHDAMLESVLPGQPNDGEAAVLRGELMALVFAATHGFFTAIRRAEGVADYNLEQGVQLLSNADSYAPTLDDDDEEGGDDDGN